MTRPDVFYIHGYEGSSQGTKGAWLQERYSCFGIDMPDAKTTHPLGREAPIGEVLAEIKAAVAPSAAFMRAHIVTIRVKWISHLHFVTHLLVHTTDRPIETSHRAPARTYEYTYRTDSYS